MSGVENLSKDELLSLLETAGKISEETDQGQLVQSILDAACRMTNSADGSVLLFDPERNGLYFAAVRGEKAGELLERWGERSNQRVPLAGSNAGDAFTRSTIIVKRQSQHFKEVDRQTGMESQSILSAPLMVRGRTIGVLQLVNKTESAGNAADYEPHDCVVVEQFGRQAAIAIDNAQLIGKLLAHMGLYSRERAGDLIERVNQPAKRERLTIMFADMRGFTQLCQSQDAVRMQKIINELLTMFADQVLTNGGIVNKFLGDGIFAFFRGEAAPHQAVKCAFGMVDHFQSLRNRWDEACNEDLGFLDIGVGIVTDDVILGTVGTAAVRDFTSIGTPVNLAKAFEAAARNGKRILVDQGTWTAVHHLIADAEGPNSFELKKPGQEAGVRFRQYQLKRLKPDIPLRVFVSHNHNDRDIANHITAQLARYGIDTWYSPSDLLPGENYIEAIRAGLMKSDWVIVIVSVHSAGSEWVRAEVKTAAADPRFRGRILPVRMDDCNPALISEDVSTVQAIDGRASTDPGETIRDLLLAREKELRAKTAAG